MSKRSRPAVSAARRAASGTASALLAALAPLAALAAVGTIAPGAGAAPAAPHTRAAFTLVDQTEWVVAPPGAGGGSPTSPTSSSSPFDLGLSVHRAPARAAVEVLLYPRLYSRYDFKNVVRNGPRGNPLSTSLPAALASLPTGPGPSGLSLDLSVVQTTSSGQASQLGLSCSPPTGTGTCTGVYPVVVELQRSTGRVLRRFTTFLTYVAGRSAHPLEVSWVVPVEAKVALAPQPSGPGRAIQPLPAAEASSLERLIAEVDAASHVPLTLDVSPETLQALDRAGPDGRAAVASIATLSSRLPTDEVLARPYVTVNLGALSAAGEPTEIRAQMAAGATVLHHFHVRTASPASLWVQTGPVGNDIAYGLAHVHATQLLLPDADVAPTSAATSSGTWVSTFPLTLSRGGSTATVDAAETDTWLDQQFTAVRRDPALAATQLLADLAMVHFERPNTAAVRGMVAVPPPGWAADPAFVRVLLDGLTGNPVVQPVTLTRFFSSVTAAGPRQLLRSGSAPSMSRAFARALSRARVRLSHFDGAVAARKHPPAVEAQLDDLLLASESQTLPRDRQAAGVATVERLLTAQLHLVKFATARTFTLTARSGWIPITIESGAPYTFVGTLHVSGNKFVFPHRGAHRVVLDHATNPSRVDVRARSSGDLPLHVAFTSPTGSLVFAHDTLTVRSTATSVVGVVLTIVALAILLTWWARTWWSGRGRRRARRVAETARGARAP